MQVLLVGSKIHQHLVSIENWTALWFISGSPKCKIIALVTGIVMEHLRLQVLPLNWHMTTCKVFIKELVTRADSETQHFNFPCITRLWYCIPFPTCRHLGWWMLQRPLLEGYSHNKENQPGDDPQGNLLWAWASHCDSHFLYSELQAADVVAYRISHTSAA